MIATAAIETIPVSAGQERFRVLYEATARPLWAYLARVSRDSSVADDLLQESYLRLLKSKLPPDASDDHRRFYLFRIATNLLHDRTRTRPSEELSPNLAESRPDPGDREDVRRAMEALSPRDRELLWLAYVEQFSHTEIADMTGLRSSSIRPMLFHARQRLLDLLRKRGFIK